MGGIILYNVYLKYSISKIEADNGNGHYDQR